MNDTAAEDSPADRAIPLLSKGAYAYRGSAVRRTVTHGVVNFSDADCEPLSADKEVSYARYGSGQHCIAERASKETTHTSCCPLRAYRPVAPRKEGRIRRTCKCAVHSYSVCRPSLWHAHRIPPSVFGSIGSRRGQLNHFASRRQRKCCPSCTWRSAGAASADPLAAMGS